MTELDLTLKMSARRLLWKMGNTTRLDVQLRGFETGSLDGTQRKQSAQSFTDLDVLGFSLGGNFALRSTIVDCKTSARGSTERMFWIRGVADLFSADSAFMLREKEITEAARQLTNRLGISALLGTDVEGLSELHGVPYPLDSEPFSYLFSEIPVERVLRLGQALPRSARSLSEYREFDYWIAEKNQRPSQLVEVLAKSASGLDASHPAHVAVVLDVAWLFAISMYDAVAQVRASHHADLERGLSQYLLGGPQGVKEKVQLSKLFTELKKSGALPATIDINPLPEFYSGLLELFTRIYRRPDAMLNILRILELATACSAFNKQFPLGETVRDHMGLIPAKLAVDIVSFLVSSTGLNTDFRTNARALILGPDREEK